MSYLKTAIRAAREAGELIRRHTYEAKEVKEKSSVHDLVTEVDQAAEERIRDVLLSAHPDHAILGEEGVEAGVEASKAALEEHRVHEHLWMVDPIDGTTNFVHGFPFFCVSIGLSRREELVAGVVYDPLRDELFTAEKGKGAYLNGRPICVSAEQELSHSLVATGFPAGAKGARRVNVKGILHLSPRCRNIRAGGAAALHLAYVASGRLSGFWELDLNAWDLAAGSLLIREAGGRVSDTLGRPYDIGVRHIVATNGAVHDELLAALKESEATGYGDGLRV
ncbi:inositol monophosphatase family protein [Desmospora profundinema]|uniref:Inositol-1-monophosphatase n=1 Tax=Desmospora profundinema TaxID=1571184 RepID=A0ABU1ISC0_9BACL|nr:inositol monophosphatase family protein [Desmospora profundinema]MDR6227343.1 myo-inositol-1(or 4)-monophosphatase [Desmospora profundinema]